MPFRVIPVLDVKQGVAVRAVAGDRAHYGPVRSLLHPGSDPVLLARALRRTLGFDELYLADLDAISGAAANVALYHELSTCGLSVWVDAGVRDLDSLGPLLRGEVATIVAGLETLRGPAALGAVLDRVGPESLVFSLDLRAGVPLIAEAARWGESDPRALARTALDLGVRRLLLLDLARVGIGQGPGTLPLLAELRSHEAGAGIEIIVGGGLSSAVELPALRRAGASAVLVGSALHDGKIGAADLELL